MIDAGDDPILTLRNIHKSFGPIEVLHEIDLQVSAGEVVALLGENGAGKSTVSNIISRAILPASGEMTWLGADRSRQPRGGYRCPEQMVRLSKCIGLNLAKRTNQLRRRFP